MFQLFQQQIPFIYCLLFGALISPTDPIAVLGILKKAKIPESLELKISGESLFNDGVAVVIFISIIEVARTGDFSALAIGELFLQEAIGGLVLGTLLGYVGGISVALALSLSPEMHRDEFVFITYIIVVFSILVQGLTIGKVAKRLLGPSTSSNSISE